MTFAKIIFTGTGVWGLVVVTPLYFLLDVTGRQYAPPTAYPHFFYGFLSVTGAWQIAFLMIGSNPARFRPLRIPSIVREAWLRRDRGRAERPGTHFSGGRGDCRARPAAGRPLHRGVREDSNTGPGADRSRRWLTRTLSPGWPAVGAMDNEAE